MQPGEITDRLFGTRAYTEGARFQIPRKIPLRIEPKTYLANERTFLSWLSMAVTLGSVGTAIAGFAVEDEDSPGQHKGGISQSTVQLMTLTMLPISICMIAYALFTFYWRSEFIRKKQIGFFDDKIGPVTVALVVEVALLIIMFSAIRDVLFY
ncbi:putative Vacuolar transporter chaperone 1 [Nannochloris sp. 'desiccata']|nr:putative Vacuolar transporter chaperone 1 [Chlorella desiccata (nom. nud.)]